MKNTTFKLSDFEAEKMNKEAQKIIRGGGSDSNDPVSYTHLTLPTILRV